VSSTPAEPAVPAPLTGDPRLVWVCRVAVGMTIVGVFGTWRSIGPVSLDGFEGPHDGWLVVIFSLIALAGVGSLSRGGRLGLVTVAGGAAAVLFTATSDLVDDAGWLGGRSGWGIWLTLAASALLAVAAVAAAAHRLPWRSGGPWSAPSLRRS
jgi:hypothetical protein